MTITIEAQYEAVLKQAEDDPIMHNWFMKNEKFTHQVLNQFYVYETLPPLRDFGRVILDKSHDYVADIMKVLVAKEGLSRHESWQILHIYCNSYTYSRHFKGLISKVEGIACSSDKYGHLIHDYVEFEKTIKKGQPYSEVPDVYTSKDGWYNVQNQRIWFDLISAFPRFLAGDVSPYFSSLLELYGSYPNIVKEVI